MSFERTERAINPRLEAQRLFARLDGWARENVRPDPHAEARRTARERRHATGAWIREQREWSHFFTLTFAWNVDDDEATQTAWAWFKWIARDHVGEHVPVAWAVERGPTRYGRVHVHGLLAVPAGTRFVRGEVATAWYGLTRTTGFPAIERYRPGRAGAWYLVKTDEWDFGVACPRRAHRCRPRCAEDQIAR